MTTIAILTRDDEYGDMFCDEVARRHPDVGVLRFDDHRHVTNSRGIRCVFVFRYGRIIPIESLDAIREMGAEIVGFHTSPLPEHRDGTPLHHQIVDGRMTSELCSFVMGAGCDDGPVLLRTSLSLRGTVDDIWRTVSQLAVDHVDRVLRVDFVLADVAIAQGDTTGQPGSRRSDNALPLISTTVDQVHRFIQILDGDGYPQAHVDVGDYRLEFSRSSLRSGVIKADVTLRKVRGE